MANYSEAVFKGKIYCDGVHSNLEVKIPDFIFEDHYKHGEKISIEDIEEYIKQNMHLEGIPHARDKKSWKETPLEERQVKLLARLEEAFLCIFKLNDIVKNNRKRIRKLEAIIDEKNK